eukprot:TRINITY_DN33554_c0_g1_i1.p1 TRINITY_DN33554_c0_g1~~TRINITY_DN33554_c0_g1_i1.p1  ORF type:complete len:148 (-),score=32.90 TRINITY_DN33554_c0_g1_i1:78-470(-)
MVHKLPTLSVLSLVAMFNYLFLQGELELEPEGKNHRNLSVIFDNCLALVNESSIILKNLNITKTCSLLEPTSCGFLMERLAFYSQPDIMFARSTTCGSLEMPEKTRGFDPRRRGLSSVFLHYDTWRCKAF